MVPTVTFLKVDIADNEALSKVEKIEVYLYVYYYVKEVPTFILYKDGKLLSRVSDRKGFERLVLRCKWIGFDESN